MINKIVLEHFKCFSSIHLPLSSLTLLSGTNATGKSSILQALALLHQTTLESEWSRSVILNGATISLGTVKDVIDKISGRNEFSIKIHSEKYECGWRFETENKAALDAPIKTIVWKEAPDWQTTKIEIDENMAIRRLVPLSLYDETKNAETLTSLLTSLCYISADRMGPREIYSANWSGKHLNVGSRGERTAWFLHYFDDRKPNSDLLLDGFAPTLIRQTEAWMDKFFPGTRFEIKLVERTNMATLGIRTNDATDFHRPQNVGYGLCYTLPILAACLGAPPESLIMIENPEAHLHPSGQSDMGEFLARVAASGRQVIVETHSDHILNGVRKAVKKKKINSEDISIHFFAPRNEENELPQVLSPIMSQNGDIDRWPPFFFDQFDKDTDFLIDWK